MNIPGVAEIDLSGQAGIRQDLQAGAGQTTAFVSLDASATASFLPIRGEAELTAEIKLNGEDAQELTISGSVSGLGGYDME